MAEGDSAASGGILVVLGIVVALGGVFFYTHYMNSSGSTAPNVTVNLSTKQ